MDSPYLVIARKYRPQTFANIIGQNAIIQTLLNALQAKRVSHAYLFSGSKGTGKTTLARVFAKAINCQNPLPSGEPCNSCTSCIEITEGRSIDVQEIDGASHRGIDHIRTLTEGASYVPVGGKYKIYLIDEVHMLTKEAFNALLKTLEEPPPSVKFFFATTEPHKMPPTIISRCQRFNLRRLSQDEIVTKLQFVTKEMGVKTDVTALNRLAEYADGGLRDAESLLDQIITFSNGQIKESLIEEVLGIVPFEWFIELDSAIETADIKVAYSISDRIFHEGKDIGHVINDITAHYRTLLLLHLHISSAAIAEDKKLLLQKVQSYLSQEHILEIFNLLAETQKSLKTASSERFLLEWLLINIVRIKQKIPLPLIVKKMFELAPPNTAISQPPSPQKPKSDSPAPLTVKSKELPLKKTTPSPKRITPEKSRPLPLETKTPQQGQAQIENLIQFAAVELGATIEKN